MEFQNLLKKNKILGHFFSGTFYLACLFVRSIVKKNKRLDESIIIISLHKIGDSIFSLPAVIHIKENYDSDDIKLLCYQETKIIFENYFKSENILTITKDDTKFENRVVSSKGKKLFKESNPSTIIDLTGSVLSASLIFNSGANKIIGMNEYHFRSLYTKFVDIRRQPHLMDRYSEVAELATGNKLAKGKYEYPISYKKRDKILIHPFAGWGAKEWGLSKFVSLTERVKEKFEASIVFPKGSVKPDLLSYLNKKKISYTETDTLKNLIEEIKNCSLFVGNDSGPLYLAVLYGKPTFTIYGPTNPEYSKPFGILHKQIFLNLSCTPIKEQYCILEAGRRCPTNECMKSLEQDYIYNELLKLINMLEIESIT